MIIRRGMEYIRCELYWAADAHEEVGIAHEGSGSIILTNREDRMARAILRRIEG